MFKNKFRSTKQDKEKQPDVTPAINQLLFQPEKVAGEIVQAIENGELNPAEAEKLFAPLLKKARKANFEFQENQKPSSEQALESLRIKLLTTLVGHYNGNENDFFNTLKDFAEKNKVELFPKPEWKIEEPIYLGDNSDWVSPDKKFAINIQPQGIYLYEQKGEHWQGKKITVN